MNRLFKWLDLQTYMFALGDPTARFVVYATGAVIIVAGVFLAFWLWP